MKDYLKQYLLPKCMGGKEYNCTLCHTSFTIRKDGKSGNRNTLSICRKCKTDLGRIEKYGSIENYKNIAHTNLSNACKEKWEDEDYRNNISKKIEESWKENGHRLQVSQSVKDNWNNKTEDEKQQKSERIKEGLKNFNQKREEKLKEFKKQLYDEYGESFISLREASNKYGISWDSIHKYCTYKPLQKYDCKFIPEREVLDVLKKMDDMAGTSNLEIELQSFIESIYKGPIIKNDRKVLDGKELDVYLPEKNLAIEFNGLYWHSDLTTDSSFAKRRHLYKTQECNKQGIELLHVFEDDWLYKKEIIQSIIKNKLNIGVQKIYARKCSIKEVDLKTYKTFLIENHLQGYSFADVRIGLYFENELIECIGIKSKGTHSNVSEMVRLCTKKSYRVVGGFSKLLKHANFNHLVSYIDVATFNGGGYELLGFKKVVTNPPTWFVVNQKARKREPRYLYMKKYLEKKLKTFDPLLTEEENLKRNNYGRIWNCGTIKVEWRSGC